MCPAANREESKPKSVKNRATFVCSTYHAEDTYKDRQTDTYKD